MIIRILILQVEAFASALVVRDGAAVVIDGGGPSPLSIQACVSVSGSGFSSPGLIQEDDPPPRSQCVYETRGNTGNAT
jgi:hypothetical protein